MHQLVIDRVEYLNEQITKVLRTDSDIELALSVNPKFHIWVDFEVNVSWAVKSIEEVKTVLRSFAEKGHLLKQFIASETTPIWYINGIQVPIRLQPQWMKDGEAEGQTCKLVKVGEKTQTYPIYKLVCEGNEKPEDTVPAVESVPEASVTDEEVPF